MAEPSRYDAYRQSGSRPEQQRGPDERAASLIRRAQQAFESMSFAPTTGTATSRTERGQQSAQNDVTGPASARAQARRQTLERHAADQLTSWSDTTGPRTIHLQRDQQVPRSHITLPLTRMPQRDRQTPGIEVNSSATSHIEGDVSFVIHELFSLTPKRQEDHSPDPFDFIRGLALKHNQEVPVPYHEGLPLPYFRMDEECAWFGRRNLSGRWQLSATSTGPNGLLPRVMMLLSPSFELGRAMAWKKATKMTWAFIHKHYTISANPSLSSTSIVVSYPMGDDMRQFKQISQAIVHFQQLLAMVMPDMLATNDASRSVPESAVREINRPQLIDAIEALPPSKGRYGRYFVNNMLERSDNRPPAWRFFKVDDIQMIQYTFNPRLQSSTDVIEWAEFVTNFVRRSLACTSPGRLQRMKPNLEGLRHFMTGVHAPLF